MTRAPALPPRSRGHSLPLLEPSERTSWNLRLGSDHAAAHALHSALHLGLASARPLSQRDVPLPATRVSLTQTSLLKPMLPKDCIGLSKQANEHNVFPNFVRLMTPLSFRRDMKKLPCFLAPYGEAHSHRQCHEQPNSAPHSRERAFQSKYRCLLCPPCCHYTFQQLACGWTACTTAKSSKTSPCPHLSTEHLQPTEHARIHVSN